jgi:hypothetical protein
MTDKLSPLVDGTTFSTLTTADQAKYESQKDGTYKLTGDPTPAADVGVALPLFANPKELGELPEDLHKYYEQLEDDKFQLRGFEDTTALKNALGHVRAERDLERDKLKKFEGYDADEYKRLQAVEDKVKKQAEIDRTEFDRQFTEASEQYKGQIKLLEEKIGKQAADLERALIDGQATRDIVSAGGSPELLLPHVRDHMKVQEVNGQHKALIIGEDGTPRLKKGATQTTDYLPLSDWIEELKENKQFAGAFAGTGASGGGATPPSGTGVEGNAPATVSKDDLKAIGQWNKSIAAGHTKVV